MTTSTCATRRPGNAGARPPCRCSGAPRARSAWPTTARSTAVGTARTPPSSSTTCRPSPTLSCGGSPSATSARAPAGSPSPRTPSWSWRRRETTTPTRPSPSCSSRPSTCPTRGRSSRIGAPDPRRTSRYGPGTWSSWSPVASVCRPPSPTGCVSSGVATRCAAPPSSSPARDRPAPWAPFWTRSSRSRNGCGCRPRAKSMLTSGPLPPPAARRSSISSTSTPASRHTSGSPCSAGPRARSSCATSASRPRRQAPSRRWRGTWSTRIRPCGRPRRSSCATRARSRTCGRLASPATCRSSSCASTTRTTPRWPASSCAPSSTGGCAGSPSTSSCSTRSRRRYVQELHRTLEAMASAIRERTWSPDSTGRIYVVQADQVAAPTLGALLASASVVLWAARGELSAQLPPVPTAPVPPPATSAPAGVTVPPSEGRMQTIVFDNGYGGFSEDGREYVTILDAGRPTPMPWSNVVANDQFGFLTTAEGAGHTWWRNSRDNQLTPWRNDPVTALASEAIYVRDDRPAWSPRRPRARWRPAGIPPGTASGTPHSCTRPTTCVWTWCSSSRAPTPVKISWLKLSNLSSERRTVTVTSYHDLVLGTNREPDRAPAGDVVRRADRRAARAQPVEHPVRRPGGLRRPRRRADVSHRGPARGARDTRNPRRASRRPRRRAALRPDRCGPGPVRRVADDRDPRARADARRPGPVRGGSRRRRGARPARAPPRRAAARACSTRSSGTGTVGWAACRSTRRTVRSTWS